jgi:hypothetical protein
LRGWGEREGVGAGGRNDPSLYAHMNNKIKKKIKRRKDPRWQLGYKSRKLKLHDAKNLPETLEPHWGNSDCF